MWLVNYDLELKEVFDGSDLGAMSFERFAELAFSYASRNRLKLQPEEKHLEKALTQLINRALKWAYSKHRITQICDPDVIKGRPKVYLGIFRGCCKAADQVRRNFVPHEYLVRLPLKECDYAICGCFYATVGIRELQRLEDAGLIGPDGDLLHPIVLQDHLPVPVVQTTPKS